MAEKKIVNETLKQLLEGNERCRMGKAKHPRQDARRRAEIAKGQKPLAVVVGCSDSRIPPPMIFDQGLGDLFVIRVAGNIVDNVGLGSIEYAVEHLGCKLVVVLGHGKCGAVTAAAEGGTAPGHIEAVLKPIRPAVRKAAKLEGDLIDNAIRTNVHRVVKKIKTAKPILAEMVEKGQVEVVGAYYDINTGKVEVL